MPSHVPGRRVAAVVPLSLLLLACDDANAPPNPVSIQISVERLIGPDLTDFPGGGAQIECAVDLRAQASGEGSATWLDARARYFLGPQGEPPVDSAVLSAADVRQGWGGPDINADSSQSSAWRFISPYPFSVELQFDYEPDVTSTTESATAYFVCGPNVTSTTPLPIVQSVQATPVAGEFTPGGEVEVTFNASSSVGIWQSLIEVTGPCRVTRLFAERLKSSVTRTERLTLPSTCELGVGVTVNVFVLDGGLRESGDSHATGLPIVDRIPPTLTPVLLSPYTPGLTSPLAGMFFDGDTIGIRFVADDNHRVEWLIWESVELGVRDSAMMPPNGPEPEVKIPFQSSHTGAFELRLTARDASGLETTHASAPNAMRLFPTVVLDAESTTVSMDVEDFVVDVPRGRLYLLQTLGSPGLIVVLAFPGLQQLSVLQLPSSANGIELTPSGDSLLVGLAGQHRSLGIIDLNQSSLQVTEYSLGLDPNLGQFPRAVTVMANGKVFVSVAGASPPAYYMLEVDLATGTKIARSDATSSPLIRSIDRTRGAQSSGFGMRRYDGATDSFGPDVDPGYTGPMISLNATGSLTSIGLSLYDDAFNYLRSGELPRAGWAHVSALTPSGGDLWHHWQFIGLLQTRTSDAAMMGRVRLGGQVDLIRFTPDGTRLIAIDGHGAQQSKITVFTLP